MSRQIEQAQKSFRNKLYIFSAIGLGLGCALVSMVMTGIFRLFMYPRISGYTLANNSYSLSMEYMT